MKNEAEKAEKVAEKARMGKSAHIGGAKASIDAPYRLLSKRLQPNDAAVTTNANKEGTSEEAELNEAQDEPISPSPTSSTSNAFKRKSGSGSGLLSSLKRVQQHRFCFVFVPLRKETHHDSHRAGPHPS